MKTKSDQIEDKEVIRHEEEAEEEEEDTVWIGGAILFGSSFAISAIPIASSTMSDDHPAATNSSSKQHFNVNMFPF